MLSLFILEQIDFNLPKSIKCFEGLEFEQLFQVRNGNLFNRNINYLFLFWYREDNFKICIKTFKSLVL